MFENIGDEKAIKRVEAASILFDIIKNFKDGRPTSNEY